MSRPSPARTLAAVLLVVAAIAFGIGVSRERAAGQTEAPQAAVPTRTSGASATTTLHSETGASGESAEAQHEAGEQVPTAAIGEAGSRHSAAGAGTHETTGETHAEQERPIFGINPESWGVVAAAVAVSLLLAAAVWFWSAAILLAGTIGVGLLLAALDIREAVHQAAESRSGLLALAVLIALLHVGVAVAAGAALNERRARSSPLVPG